MSTYGYERQEIEAQAGAGEQQAGRPGYESYDYDTGTGSTGVAAWLLILGGLLSFLIGLAILVRKSYFTSLPSYSSATHHYLYQWNLSGWGWGNLILGIVVVLVGTCVLLGQTWARWAGVVLAIISAVGSFLFLPFFPLWSIVVIAIDVFIVWALATGKQFKDV